MLRKTTLFGIFILLFLGFQEAYAQPYKAAVGLRVPWGIGINGKYFLNEGSAVEAIFTYRSFGVPGFDYNWFRITGVYEVQKDLDDVLEGLDWYFGGGASIAFYGGDWDFPGSDFNSTTFGITGVIGLEYVFEDVPISIVVDWMPTIFFSGDNFNGESGIFGVRYAIK